MGKGARYKRARTGATKINNPSSSNNTALRKGTRAKRFFVRAWYYRPPPKTAGPATVSLPGVEEVGPLRHLGYSESARTHKGKCIRHNSRHIPSALRAPTRYLANPSLPPCANPSASTDCRLSAAHCTGGLTGVLSQRGKESRIYRVPFLSFTAELTAHAL